VETPRKFIIYVVFPQTIVLYSELKITGTLPPIGLAYDRMYWIIMAARVLPPDTRVCVARHSRETISAVT
jgi:hypothetical protein